MEAKQCTKCGEAKELKSFRERKSKTGRSTYRIGTCHQCELIAAKQYRKDNLLKCKESLSKWKKENKERHCMHSKKSHHKHRAERNLCAREYRKNNPDIVYRNNARIIAELHDCYIRGELRRAIRYMGIKIESDLRLPTELVDSKRTKIMMSREIKKQKTIIKEVSNVG